MLVVMAELLGYLGPIGTLLGIYCSIIAFLKRILKPTAVPVDIKEGIHAVADHPSYHLVDTVEPC